MQIVKYKPARFGLGTESSQNLQPLDFAPDITNRFYNLLGDLEKRPGMARLGRQITTAGGSLVSAEINNLHEYVDASGNSTLFSSGRYTVSSTVFGGIWRYIPATDTWAFISNFVDSTEFNPDYKIYSVQMNDKLIFCNGYNRNKFLDRQSISTSVPAILQPLYSTVIKGITGAASTSTLLVDNDITNWRTQTNVAINDVVLTQVASADSLSIITSIGTTSLDVIDGSLTANLPYRIIDLVELNIIPNSNPGGTIYDNVAVAGAATGTGIIAVTAFDFTKSDIRAGDYVYNTTRSKIRKVTGFNGTSITVASVASQTAGDSLVFLKDSMPIASYAHVHYGRLHLIDARDPTKIRVSGPNDPEDFTTFSKTLSSVTIDYGSRQPKGDVLLTMDTFQRYLVVGGRQSVYVTDGTNPIADVTADVIDLDPVGLFPQGVVSPLGLKSIGNEMLYIGRDGLRAFLAAFDSRNTTTNNKSEQIKTELIQLISEQLDTPDNIQLVHYPRRNWVLVKVGDNMYNYNYTPTYQVGQFSNFGTITRFRGLLAEQDAFLVRRDGSLLTCDSTGSVYEYDVTAVDNGNNIYTTYTSPWHTLQEGQTDLMLINKDGRYVKPIFETYGEIEYTISVVGDYIRQSTDSVIVTAKGAALVGIGTIGSAVIENTAITDPKVPLRWRGEQFQINITTDSPVGGDIINSYTIYGNVFGRK